MAALRNEQSIAARALMLRILAAARTAEVVGARWSEFENGVWTIPGERMKAGKSHSVPVSGRAMKSLLPREGEYVFIGSRPGKPLGPVEMLRVLRGLFRIASPASFSRSKCPE
jgi:integrase